EVLRCLARILAGEVRERDLPARLSGDEFVVVFPRSDPLVAQQVCERVCTGIAAFDWHSIVPGLAVSVSVGVGEAQAGDTADSLLHRGDMRMYAQKQRKSRHEWTDGG
ncbi:MAG TPA: GGDEF domain-containing protein, partial [Albitalea sp.]|nr:GGDEF domain-containing protein [Albitalea sp.]